MGAKTGIAWTDHTFNPVWGCTKVSPACANCYAERMSERWGWDVWGADSPRRTFGRQHWAQPLKWNDLAEKTGECRRVFVGSMCDFCEGHPTTVAEMKKLWPLIRQTPGLDWLLLTKRPERLASVLPIDWGPRGYANVWLGVSIENAEYARRAYTLREIPAAVRFVSYEPALGPLADGLDLSGIDWVIYGGESGPGYRPHEVQWARDIRTKCAAAGVAFFYKQSPGPRMGMGETLDGEMIREYPAWDYKAPGRL